MRKNSPFKNFGISLFPSGMATGAGFSAPGTGGFLGLGLAMMLSHMAKARETHRKLAEARRKEGEARRAMNRYKNVYENLQVTNPYSNLKNPFENIGLSIDRRKALFEKDQFMRGQANMLSGLQQSGGGSGMANRVRMLSQMGMEAAQKSAESIGQQESRFRLLEPQMYAKIDQLERSGRNIGAMFEKDKYAKLMGLAQTEMFTYMENKYNQEQAKAKNFSNMQQNFLSLAGGTSSRWQGMPGGGGGGSSINASII